ncbi:cryptochrome/photolyase family protein [Streptomyces flavofungini]|uniref:Deoxyribodipyrimidine photo-lyase n=1 Tax=Streptomyces flavofungini TaxID=68200 RepID=A0ABS0X8X1_9ACTN|nr:deoxyribodipyrimidine photo-lyase [Streptomyces flavofungini]MBJ3809446.1 deoxyribodipyrimidine photo-lyase [Streptomyces flavofungini]GHC78326.1 deoxyribodipyrimidine photo-lyase [Streptomyces flavofungini]
MATSIVLFTADLRLHDHPPLRAALAEADEVVPLFVRDDNVAAAGFAAPNRLAFLADCLTALDAALRERGGRLVVRSGDVVDQVGAVVAATGAGAVHMAAGVSGFAQDRERRLRAALAERGCALHVHDCVVTAVAPGAVTPANGDHFAVFTPYYRRWSQQGVRDVVAAPRTVRVPSGLASERVPARADVREVSPGVPPGGEAVARTRLAAWLRSGIAGYADGHDDLAGDRTSRLSPHVHFGTLSPVELVHRAGKTDGPGPAAFVRQLCWRDFHHQVLAARPRAAWADYRDRQDRWRGEDEAADDIEAWRRGRTGFPAVDAAMRQLAHEGWLHNRGRLIAASFLTKTLYVDWRIGARHFLRHLVDGDIADNQLNWQWTAGTGNDTRPNRVLNPVLQGKRHDPEGAYVRRWVPELAELAGAAVHEPWRLTGLERARFDYPEPIVDLAEGLARFRQARDRS